jgi:hypothetical protein
VQGFFTTETALLDLAVEHLHQLIDSLFPRGVIEIVDFETGLGETARQKPHRHGRAAQAVKDYNLSQRFSSYSRG